MFANKITKKDNKMPKIIHYFYDDIKIWKKGTKPHFRMCYASWLRFCPDYEIKLWHIGMPEFKEILKDSKFMRECYKRKLWAFIADYIRHYALYHYGGIYLDTDVELVKNLDEFVDKPFFCSIEGDFYKRKNIVESAVMGGQKGHKVFRDMLDIYNTDKIFAIPYFIDPIVLTDYLNKHYGFENINYPKEYISRAKDYYKNTDSYQLADFDLYKNQQITKIKDLEIYPSMYFCPTWNAFGNKAFTQNTFAIHWNQSSWWAKKREVREVQSLRYSNPLKRFLFIHSPRLAKIFSAIIPNRKLRRRVRDFLTLQ